MRGELVRFYEKQQVAGDQVYEFSHMSDEELEAIIREGTEAQQERR